MGKIYSPGKLLLTSEYVVLDGALALAIPTKWGQEFFFEEINDNLNSVQWTALHEGKPWLEAIIDYEKGEVVYSNIPEAAQFVLKVLMNVRTLSKTVFQNNSSYRITTNLQFPANYGLGSSSTLMNNLAEWSSVDPFKLNEICLGGSGYDIAVAHEKSAILFQNKEEKPISQPVFFDPPFKDDLLFIHLNKKQDSREGIDLYRKKVKSSALIEEFSHLTHEIFKTKSLTDFSDLMTVHEEKLSSFLGLKTVKENLFSEAPVFVKSLGAWGGDFVMSSKFPGFQSYFQGKGFSTIFNYNQLID